jgi:hypothetical protein
MQYQRGMLVRLKRTGALFEIKDVKGDDLIEIFHGPSKLTVSTDAVNVVREYHDRKESIADESFVEQTQ